MYQHIADILSAHQVVPCVEFNPDAQDSVGVYAWMHVKPLNAVFCLLQDLYKFICTEM